MSKKHLEIKTGRIKPHEADELPTIRLAKNALNLTNQKLGRLTCMRPVGRSRVGNILWLCECECGTLAVVEGVNLKRGNTTSCGCRQEEGRPRAGHAVPAALSDHSLLGQIKAANLLLAGGIPELVKWAIEQDPDDAMAVLELMDRISIVGRDQDWLTFLKKGLRSLIGTIPAPNQDTGAGIEF